MVASRRDIECFVNGRSVSFCELTERPFQQQGFGALREHLSMAQQSSSSPVQSVQFPFFRGSSAVP